MTYHKIMTAVDESPAGAHALRVGDQLAAAAEAQLVVLRVVDEPWRFVAPGEVEVKRALRDNAWEKVAAVQVSDELRQLAASEDLSIRHVATAVRFGTPGIEIARSAEQERADLIVLGRQPAGPHHLPPTGGTIEGTLRWARVPCLIVPFGDRTWRRVLVLSHEGVAAGDVLAQAFRFAEVFGSEVTVLDVEPQLAVAGGSGTEVVARKAFTVWARLPGTGAFDVVVREGDPATEILRAAREQQADLLVIGYGRGEDVDAVSAGARIVRRARCAVLAVPV